ncbi:acyltransferase [bacterium]|nr:acyltransferase [bacterium]
MADSKNSGVEFFRVVAAFAVVCIHSAPFVNYPSDTLYPLTNHLTRFAVPFFFTLSGYFFGVTLKKGKSVEALFWKYFKRLVLLFLVWSVFYFLIPHAGIREKLRLRPIDTLLEGGTTHLWYFTALISALAGLFLSLKRKRFDVFLAVSILFFAAALWIHPYSVTHGAISLPFNLRNGPFFSSIFVAVGYWLSQQKRLPSLKVGYAVAALGWLCQELEIWAIWKHWRGDSLQDFTLGTLGFGVGMAVVALQTRLPSALKGVASFGKYTLGIYLVHFSLLGVIAPLFSARVNPTSLLWQFTYPLAVFLSALGVTAFLFRFRPLRPLFS